MGYLRSLILSRFFQLALRFAIYLMLVKGGWGAAHAGQWSEGAAALGTGVLLTVVDLFIHSHREARDRVPDPFVVTKESP